MKYFKLFEDFKNDKKSALKKVYLATKTTSGQAYLSNKGFASDKFFIQVTEKNIDDIEINPNYPILNYQSDIINQLLDEGRIKEGNIYNLPKDINLSGSKKKFHELLGDDINIPKTVFSKEDALSKLKFPLIGKPAEGHSGIGIKIFNTKKDFENINEKDFDVFSEFIDKKEEHRFFAFNGNPIFWMERTPANNKAKTGTGDADEKMGFDYTKREIQKIPNDYLHVLEKFCSKFDMFPFICFDMMKCNDNKIYIIESNCQPGVPFDSTVEIYKSIYEDFYDTKIDENSMKVLNSFSKDLIDKTIKGDTERFSIK